jgi:arylsulfatase A-like enzyme
LPRYPAIDWLKANDDDQLKRCNQAYLACISFVDAQVGRVLDVLEQSPHADNTLIVLFSDHGYHLGEKSRVSKQGLWEESTRVPMIISQPGQTDSRISHRPVGLIDLYPTLVDLCELPQRPANSGRSLSPLLDNPDAKWRHSVLTTYARGNHALRSERYRYIKYDDPSEELYDHQGDPHEWTNLASHPAHASLLKRFRLELPVQEAPYHPSVGNRPINSWFAEHYKTLGVSK